MNEGPTRAQISGVILYVCLGVLGLLFFYMNVQMYVLVDAVRETQTNTSGPVLAAINDCTNPEGECYKDGQKRTAQAVVDIATRQLFTAVCIATERQPEMTADALLARVEPCVAELLRRS